MTSVDFDREGKIFLVGHLDHARHPDEIDLGWKIETAYDWRACENQDVYVGISQLGGNGQGSTNVAQAIGVVGVHQNIIGGLAGHAYFQSNPSWRNIANVVASIEGPVNSSLKTSRLY